MGNEILDVLKRAGLDIEDLVAASNTSLEVYNDQRGSKYGIGCAIYQSEVNPNQVIVSFKGTDSLPDAYMCAGIAIGGRNEALKQYVEAITKELKRELHGREVLITGHSLGGATAIQASLNTGWPTIAFDPPGFRSWEDIPHKPANIVIVDSEKNDINRTGSKAKKGFEKISLSPSMKEFLREKPKQPFASHRMSNIHEVLLKQIDPGHAIQTPMSMINQMRHDFSVDKFNMNAGFFGNKKQKVSFFQLKWKPDIDPFLVDSIRAIECDNDQAISAAEAGKKDLAKETIGKARSLLKEALSELFKESKLWNRVKTRPGFIEAKMNENDPKLNEQPGFIEAEKNENDPKLNEQSGFIEAEKNENDPKLKEKIGTLRRHADIIAVKIRQVHAAVNIDKTREKAINAYREELNTQVRYLGINFDETTFSNLASCQTPDFRRGIDLALLNAVSTSCEARCDAQRNIVLSFNAANDRVVDYERHASAALDMHGGYLGCLNNISERIQSLAKPSMLHMYGNYQRARAAEFASSGHPAALAVSLVVSSLNGMLQGSRQRRLISLQGDAHDYEGLARRTQANYSQSLGLERQWMGAANDLAVVLLQNAKDIEAKVLYQSLVRHGQSLSSKDKSLSDAKAEKQTEIEGLENEIRRFEYKETYKKGDKLKKVQKDLAKLRQDRAEAQLELDRLQDSHNGITKAQRSISPIAAAARDNSTTLASLDKLRRKYSRSENRVEDGIFEQAQKSADSLDKDQWDEILDNDFADACDPNKNKEESRKTFADKVVSDMTEKGITITREQAEKIYDAKLSREGKKLILDKVERAITTFMESHRVQDQLVGEGGAAVSDFMNKLVVSGLCERIPVIKSHHLQRVNKVVNLGTQSYQIYTLARDTFGIYEVLSSVSKVEVGAKAALESLSLNYVTLAINLVKLGGGLLQLYNTAADKHPGLSQDTQAVLKEIKLMRESLEGRLDTAKKELGHVRDDLMVVREYSEQSNVVLMGGADKHTQEKLSCSYGSRTLEEIRAKAQELHRTSTVSDVSAACKNDVTGATTPCSLVTGLAYLVNSHLAGHLPGVLNSETGLDWHGLSNPYVLSNMTNRLLLDPRFKSDDNNHAEKQLEDIADKAKDMDSFSDELRSMKWAGPKLDELKSMVDRISDVYEKCLAGSKNQLDKDEQTTRDPNKYVLNLAISRIQAKYNSPENWLSKLSEEILKCHKTENGNVIDLSIPLISKGPNKTNLDIKNAVLVEPSESLMKFNYLPILLPKDVMEYIPKKSQELEVLFGQEKSGLVKTRYTYDLSQKKAIASESNMRYPVQGFSLVLNVEYMAPGHTKYQLHSKVEVIPFVPVFDSYDPKDKSLDLEKNGYQFLLMGLYGQYFLINDKSPIDNARDMIALQDPRYRYNLQHAPHAHPALRDAPHFGLAIFLLYSAPRWAFSKYNHNHHWVTQVLPGLYGKLNDEMYLENIAKRPYQILEDPFVLPRVQEQSDPPSLSLAPIPVSNGVYKLAMAHKFLFPRRDWKPYHLNARMNHRTPENIAMELSHCKLQTFALHTMTADVHSSGASFALYAHDIMPHVLKHAEMTYRGKFRNGKKVSIALDEYTKIYATFVHALRHEFDLSYTQAVVFLAENAGLLHPEAFKVMAKNTPEQLPRYAATIKQMKKIEWNSLFKPLRDSGSHNIISHLKMAKTFVELGTVLSLEQDCEVTSDYSEVEQINRAIYEAAVSFFRRDFTPEWYDAFIHRNDALSSFQRSSVINQADENSQGSPTYVADRARDSREVDAAAELLQRLSFKDQAEPYQSSDNADCAISSKREERPHDLVEPKNDNYISGYAADSNSAAAGRPTRRDLTPAVRDAFIHRNDKSSLAEPLQRLGIKNQADENPQRPDTNVSESARGSREVEVPAQSFHSLYDPLAELKQRISFRNHAGASLGPIFSSNQSIISPPPGCEFGEQVISDDVDSLAYSDDEEIQSVTSDDEGWHSISSGDCRRVNSADEYSARRSQKEEARSDASEEHLMKQFSALAVSAAAGVGAEELRDSNSVPPILLSQGVSKNSPNKAQDGTRAMSSSAAFRSRAKTVLK